jgi:hypothetical protein
VDEQEVLARVAKNMRTVEERLANKELGEGTKQFQRDILHDLDELIKLSQSETGQGQQDQQDQGEAGSKSDKSGNQQAKGSAGKRNSQMKGGQSQRAQRQARRAQRRGQQRLAGQNGQNQQSDEQQQGNQQQAGNTLGAGKTGLNGEMNKIADLYKDIWGHLPETMRAEMDAYARERFMARYEELIKHYYDRAARESRRKGD